MAPPLIIGNDRGGLLVERLREVAVLRESNRPVRIMGAVCYSTCTLYLGLPQTCISAKTLFGFHGPSSFGRPLQPVVFERASLAIASHYPPALKHWYITKARFKIASVQKVDGAQIIRMGVPAC
ncbi:MAG: hypothetical protein ACSHWZ_00480 [Sulfitobacter sp.]